METPRSPARVGRRAALPRDRGAVVHRGFARQPGIFAFLLHPRAPRALHHPGARTLSARVVFRAGAACRSPPLDRGPLPRPRARMDSRSGSPFPAAAFPASVVRGRFRVLFRLGLQARLLHPADVSGAGTADRDPPRLLETDLPPELYAGYLPWLTVAGIVLAAAGIASASLCRRRAAAALTLALGGLAWVQIVLSGHETLAPAFSAYHVVQKIRGDVKPDVPFYVVDTFDHTLLFYLGRTVTMVVNKDELAQPIAWEPREFLPDAAAFARAWQADREAFALFNANDLDVFLKSHPVPMQIVARDARRVIVKKP